MTVLRVSQCVRAWMIDWLIHRSMDWLNDKPYCNKVMECFVPYKRVSSNKKNSTKNEVKDSPCLLHCKTTYSAWFVLCANSTQSGWTLYVISVAAGFAPWRVRPHRVRPYNDFWCTRKRNISHERKHLFGVNPSVWKRPKGLLAIN